MFKKPNFIFSEILSLNMSNNLYDSDCKSNEWNIFPFTQIYFLNMLKLHFIQ